jgi:hypothetical protein
MKYDGCFFLHVFECKAAAGSVLRGSAFDCGVVKDTFRGERDRKHKARVFRNYHGRISQVPADSRNSKGRNYST